MIQPGAGFAPLFFRLRPFGGEPREGRFVLFEMRACESQLPLGFAAAFVSGFFACQIMISLVRRAQLKWFGLYCALVGLAVLIWMA